MTNYTHEFYEAGNGFPSVGDEVIVNYDESGNYGLAKVAAVSSIQTRQWKANWIYLTLEDPATYWDDLEPAEQDRLYDSLHHVKPFAGAETIRYSSDASVCMVWSDGEPVRCPSQHDMDNLPVGGDMDEDELAQCE